MFQNKHDVSIRKLNLSCWNLELKWRSQFSCQVAGNGVFGDDNIAGWYDQPPLWLFVCCDCLTVHDLCLTSRSDRRRSSFRLRSNKCSSSTYNYKRNRRRPRRNYASSRSGSLIRSTDSERLRQHLYILSSHEHCESHWKFSIQWWQHCGLRWFMTAAVL